MKKLIQQIYCGRCDNKFTEKAVSYIQQHDIVTETKEEIKKITERLHRIGVRDETDLKYATTGAVNLFMPKPVGSQAIQLMKSLGIPDSNASLECCRLIGNGYNIFTDRSAAGQIFDFETVDSVYGIAIPTCAKFVEVIETKKFLEEFKDKSSFVRQRMTNLGLAMPKSALLFRVEGRAGFNYVAEAAEEHSTREFSFLFQQRLLQLKIGNFKNIPGISFTKDFTDAVSQLPTKYNASN